MMATDAELAGRALREHVPVDSSPTAHAVERARLVSAAIEPRQDRWLPVAAIAFVTAALALALVVWQRFGSGRDALAFTVGPDVRDGQVGLYYAATADAELPLRFSDGSVVLVQPRGGVRVHRTATREVALFVETGRAQFDVVHREGARWDVAAGPYTVNVTGTAFDLDWDPETRKFGLAMRSGSVTVRGPGIETGVVVKDAERFASQVTVDVERPATPTGAAPSAVPEPATSVRAPSIKPPAPKAEPSWAELLAKGEYGSIVRAAEERGVDRTNAEASADELRVLADAARFSGRSALAQRALLAVRSRFPGTKAATGAAFVIGRQFDGSGDMRSAVTWYDRYLAEGGPLAAEAAGRKMLALRRMGDSAASRTAAADYLKRFPAGPYAQQARTIVR
jgi:transmembrane sensor